MLAHWLGELPLATFLDSVFGREPLARPAAAAAAIPLFEWRTFDALLGRRELDALVVRGGREFAVPPPRDRAELGRLLASGLGLVIRRAERLDPGLAGLARRLAQELAGQVHVQLFVTAARTNGFGWHYDAEHVFIVQTVGTKTFYFRCNTVDPPRDAAQTAPPDFARVREETTPRLTCRLEPGDWLYLPRGWWHVAVAESDSLSISLGVSRKTPEEVR
jgi:50S ribosomal protein L16 3-hydroxylase